MSTSPSPDGPEGKMLDLAFSLDELREASEDEAARRFDVVFDLDLRFSRVIMTINGGGVVATLGLMGAIMSGEGGYQFPQEALTILRCFLAGVLCGVFSMMAQMGYQTGAWLAHSLFGKAAKELVDAILAQSPEAPAKAQHLKENSPWIHLRVGMVVLALGSLATIAAWILASVGFFYGIRFLSGLAV